MPPKADPYATPAQKSFDLLLILLTIAMIALAFYTAKAERPETSSFTQNADTLK